MTTRRALLAGVAGAAGLGLTSPTRASGALFPVLPADTIAKGA